VRWERRRGAGLDPQGGFSPADGAAQWQRICDFDNALHPPDNVEALGQMMANLQRHGR